MTLSRARIIKSPRDVEVTQTSVPPEDARSAVAPSTRSVAARPAEERARRMAADVVQARAEAARILTDAHARRSQILAEASASAMKEAREREEARLAASFLALRAEDERRIERDLDRVVELAVLLAERLLGEALRVEPSRIASLLASALEETRGARGVRIDASPEDVAALDEALLVLEYAAKVEPDPALQRGSLVVHTDLGRVDARLEPQLARLSVALREALK